MRLQHVASSELLLFPENAEGYLAKVSIPASLHIVWAGSVNVVVLMDMQSCYGPVR